MLRNFNDIDFFLHRTITPRLFVVRIGYKTKIYVVAIIIGIH